MTAIAIGDIVAFTHGRHRFVAVVDRPRPDLIPPGRWWDLLYRDRGQVTRLAIGDGAIQHLVTPSFVAGQELRHDGSDRDDTVVTVVSDEGPTVTCISPGHRHETRGGEHVGFPAAPCHISKPRLVLSNLAKFYPQPIQQQDSR